MIHLNTSLIIHEGEILNSYRIEYPLFHVILYGDKISTAYHPNLEKRSSIFKVLFFECFEDDISSSKLF